MKVLKESVGEMFLIFIVALCLLGFIVSTAVLPLAYKGLAQNILMVGASASIINAVVEFKHYNKKKKFVLSNYLLELFGVTLYILTIILAFIVMGPDKNLIDFGGLCSMICILECSTYHLYNDKSYNPSRKQI